MFLKSYGRPSWYRLLDESFLNVVSRTLFGRSFNPRNPDHVFAAFSHRLLLNLVDESNTSKFLQNEVIQRHARILVSLDGGRVRSASPSEPLLSIVSAHNLNNESSIYDTAISALVDKLILQADIIDPGSIGTLYSRLLLHNVCPGFFHAKEVEIFFPRRTLFRWW
ncbi:hypothetical protein QCA50_006356 [Cerrena zonata]|uniref:Uncharacterized protein n=1 Tax=Cerrena zonata TaxID=2478898 RepID=A0AAW0GDU7_9APHY